MSRNGICGSVHIGRRFAGVLCVVLGVGALASCGGGGSDDGAVTVWSIENEPDRIQAQERILKRFTDKTGTKVELKGIEEDQLSTLITSAAAGGKLPDAIFALPLAYTQRLAAERVSDPEAATEVVDELGRETFSKRALELATLDDQMTSVPSDGWGQMIFYRTDLFEKAGLPAPDNYAALEQAAKRLHSEGVAGIALGRAANDTYTQESFEALALANGCQLVEGGTLTLNSPECQRALELYAKLATEYSVPGNQEFEATRATYFSGKSAMVVWSSFLLDELAGLRDDAKPTCPECRDDPEYLAKNTGVVTQLQGDGGAQGAQYGDLAVFGIMTDAHSVTKDLIKFMMSDGYEDWFGLAPEGKIPVRLGTPDEPRKYIDDWARMEIGVDQKKPINAIYDEEVIDAVRGGAERFTRWGFPQGQGVLVGLALGELPATTAVTEVIEGASPQAALEKAQGAYERLQDRAN